MIFIHGGGLTAGSGDMDISGIVRNFVSKGIVVASLQYRLGWLGKNLKKSFKISFLGFFTTFTDDFPPNLGMLDQVNEV